MNGENVNDRLARLVSRFATAARAHQEALEELDESRAGTQVRIIAGLFEAIVREGNVGREALLALTESDNQVVAGMAAVYSMRYDPPRCLTVLRRLATQEGLLGFRASVAVERWEKGEWDGP
jgi:hypothetical protein